MNKQIKYGNYDAYIIDGNKTTAIDIKTANEQLNIYKGY